MCRLRSLPNCQVNFAEYAKHGWALCSIDPGTKGPTYAGWNTKPIPAEAVDGLVGAGLLHVLSGTCAIDLDNLPAARAWLAERGVDIDALLEADDAVRIDSGRPNRAKLLYKMSKPLRTYKPKDSGLELRSATAAGKSMQDVLPPTIHRDTKKPYRWAGGILSDWRSLPSIPASLLAVWRSLGAEDASPEPIETIAPRLAIDIGQLRKGAFTHSPDCEYDEWIKVGSRLHDGTGGAQEGFDIWCEWSRGIKRKAYPGDGVLKTHWLSFSSSPGKRVASGASLAAEAPAAADEFPIETGTSTETTEKLMRETARGLKQAAIETLEKRLVYVHSVERYFDTERHKIIGSDNALEHMFTHLMPVAGKRRLSPIKILKESGSKRFVDALGFHPGENVIFKDRMGDEFANTYKKNLPAPLPPTSGELERISWLFNRIDDEAYRSWLLQFFGHVVQFPGKKIKSAPLIWSDTQGNGKTTLLKMIPSLITGARYSREVTCALLNSDFNDYLLNAWHVNLTEFRAGTRGDRMSITQKLKSWITDDEIAVHPKGLSAYSMPNHFFVTATSNEDDAAAIDNNDRRWAIHEMHAPQFTESEQDWVYTDFLLTSRAPGVLRHFFLNTEITDFSASAKAIETDARREMVASSISSEAELLQIAFEQRSEPMSSDVVITNDVTTYVRKHTRSSPSASRIGRLLSKPPFNGTPLQFRCGGAVYRSFVLRNYEKWVRAPGEKIMEHICGETVDLTT